MQMVSSDIKQQLQIDMINMIYCIEHDVSFIRAITSGLCMEHGLIK